MKERTKKITAVKSAAEVRFAFTTIDQTRLRSNMINVGRFVSAAFRDAALFKAERKRELGPSSSEQSP